MQYVTQIPRDRETWKVEVFIHYSLRGITAG